MKVDPADPAHDPRYADVVVALADGVILRPASVGATAPISSPAPLPSASDFARYQEKHLLVLGCDYRGEQIQGVGGGCGCTKTWFCAAGRGTFASNPFEVALSECLNCVSTTATGPSQSS